MPSAIVATTSATNANSYGTLAEAETYFEDRLYATNWTGEGDDDKKTAALLWAAKVLDTRVKWNGVKTSLAQAMQWPRSYVDDPDVTGIPPGTSFTLDHWYLDSATIPRFLKWAQFELALALIGSDVTVDPQTYGFRQIAVGPISLTVDQFMKTYVLPLPVRDLVGPYGTLISGGSMQRKLLRA